MSVPRAITQRVGCRACNAAIARSASPNPFVGSNSLRAWQTSGPLRRTFASTTIQRKDTSNLSPLDKTGGLEFLEPAEEPASKPAPTHETVEAAEKLEAIDLEAIESTETSPSATAASNSTASDPQEAPIPWYLRAQSESNPEGIDPNRNPRELIPELPHNPPPLLQTLLEYISITAGLDDLLLFDLRHLDPPPALGSKLIMIIGTARSEKHLHVSADRFCRYLRREHGLKANAAGLLGRNELKIKLRRKAKRMKMLANVGAQESTNIDDGIRTGWICCTIGRIEAHPEDTHIPGLANNDEEFVGFRDVKPGVNVVVQMFTEEKRNEIDLETLWGGVLKSHERKDAVADEQLRELDEHLSEQEREALVGQERQKRVEDALDAALKRPKGKQEQWESRVPKPSKGDEFPPPSWEKSRGQQVRRLHTVGL